MTRPPTRPIGLMIGTTMASADISAESISPLSTPRFPPRTPEYDQQRRNLIEGVRKQYDYQTVEAQAKPNECRETREPQVCTGVSKINERVGATVVINCYFQNGEKIPPPVRKTARQQHHLCC